MPCACFNLLLSVQLGLKEQRSPPQIINKSIFDDINTKLPPVNTAFKVQRKAKTLNLSYKNYDEALDDLISEINELKESNIRVLSDNPTTGAEGYKVVFIHPKSTGGVLVELAEKS